MKNSILICLILITEAALAYSPDFPVGPNPQLTPGKLCNTPTAFRYTEHIAYCERDVTFETKEFLIKQYDQQLGYHIENLERGDFKIDHYIPLCVGGSNDISNLWPQHKSVYEITDPVEPLVCKKMLAGKLKQADAVQLIIRAKNNLNQVGDVMKILNQIK
jgi:hypothetical protein